MGWLPANYAGFPIFYHYFPLTFLFMAVLSYLMPLQISFKLITVLGTFLLPLCVYIMFRAMKYKHPVPIVGAIFSLAFLFNEHNSMWGGNILSTLAGEFSFSFSLAVFVAFIGTFYQGIKENKYIVLNAILFFLMGFSHGYTLVFFAFLSLYFLFSRSILKNSWYMFRVYALGGALLAFWFLPFLANTPYVIPFHVTWYFGSIWEIFPPILIPLFVLSVISLITNFRDQRNIFWGYLVVLTIVLYFLGPKVGLVDIRFLTFVQFFGAIIGATLIKKQIEGLRFVSFIPFILVLLMFIWVSENSRNARNWIEWNYSGFEKKTTWSEVVPMFDYLRQTNDGGRVVYENAAAHNTYGSMRIFESLRLFAGRDTLEGLYMQSSISSPFVFYIQSEISKDVSAPYIDYKVSPFNLKNGAQHLNAFNVVQFIVHSDKVKKAISNLPEYEFEKRFGILDVYRVVKTDQHYVIPAKYVPVRYNKKDWKTAFYQWFKRPEIQDVPVVYVKDPEDDSFTLVTNDATNPPEIPFDLPKFTISEKMGNETIEFTTSLIGHPHIIRVSYHPNWQVEGADKIYLVSPSFMLVYPNQDKVKLTFAKSKFNYVGEVISLVALFAMIIYQVRRFSNVKQS